MEFLFCDLKNTSHFLKNDTFMLLFRKRHKKGITHAEKINEVPRSHKKLPASNMDESRAAKDLFAPIGFRCIEA